VSKPAIDKHVLDLLTGVSKLLGPIGAGEAETPRYLLQVLALFDRCRSMLGAIRLLLGYNCVHEAVILARPLFADSLTLAEIAAAGETERKRLALGREMAGLADMEGVLREAESRGGNIAKGMAKIAERRTHLEEFARRENLSTRQWRPDDHLKDLAAEHGEGDEYLDIRFTHLFVHGSTSVTIDRYSQRDDGTWEVGGPAADFKPWANGTGFFAAQSALRAGRAACRIFGWDEPRELQVLMWEVIEELRHTPHL
jgi:hypothetical protein